MHFSQAIALAGLASSASAAYNLQKDYMDDFFGSFNFINGPDPTHGFVNYVDQDTAFSKGYASTSKGVYIGVDSENVVTTGRDSVRLESKDSYDQGLIILDLAHMPGSINGVWPAFWTYGPNWPSSGEIDIIEGVNTDSTNQMTLHLGNPSCNGIQDDASLSIDFEDCYAMNSGNRGCGFKDNDSSSYGDGLNAAGGGVFAMENTGNTIRIWKFGRGDDTSNVLSGSPDPSTWGKPRAAWQSKNGCDLSNEVKNQRITFDTTFCGDWAGAVFDGGLGACESFVGQNPQAFKDAFWNVNSLKVFTNDGRAAAATTTTNEPPPPPPSTTTETQPSTTDLPAFPSEVSSTTVTSFTPSTTDLPPSFPSTTDTPTGPITTTGTPAAPSSVDSTLPAVSAPPVTTTDAPTSTSPPGPPAGRPTRRPNHSRGGHRHKPTQPAVPATEPTPSTAPLATVEDSNKVQVQPTPTSVPWSVIYDPVTGTARLVQEPPTRRDLSARQHARQFGIAL